MVLRLTLRLDLRLGRFLVHLHDLHLHLGAHRQSLVLRPLDLLFLRFFFFFLPPPAKARGIGKDGANELTAFIAASVTPKSGGPPPCDIYKNIYIKIYD